MITVVLHCAMCGKERRFDRTSETIGGATTLEQIIKDADWIGEQAGKHFSIYCSKKCAE